MLLVLDKGKAPERVIRTAVDTMKLLRASGLSHGDDHIEVRAALAEANLRVGEFTREWLVNPTMPHPNWVVYCYEILDEERAPAVRK